MIKTVNADIDVEVNVYDVQEFLTNYYPYLSSYERGYLLKNMKEIVLDSSLSSLTFKLDINDMIYLFKYNSNLAHEVKEYLNKNEMV